MNGVALDGVLPVDKPVGPTSHDVVAQARKALGIRRVGHTGTLDPFASGLLLLCLGRATRLAEYLTGLPKSYTATARLGVSTDTLDLDGETVATDGRWTEVDDASIEAAAASLRGDLLQIPPQYSAKKVDGVAMHRRARRGEVVPLAPRPVTIYSLEIQAVELPLIRFTCRCSTGTYIRALARDLGEALGVGAHLTELRRTSIGDMAVDRGISIEALRDRHEVATALLTPLAALSHLPRVGVGGEGAASLRHGKALSVPGIDDSSTVVAAHGDELLAIGEVKEGSFRPRKVFVA